MKKELNKIKGMGRIPEKIMLAILASSIVMTPTVKSSVLAYETTYAKAVAAAVNAGEVVSIIESKGWLESAKVTWAPVENATGYSVYYKASSEADSQYKRIDSNLIRRYPNYFRADLLGLASGNYIIKVVPIIDGNELSSAQAITQNIEVKAHAREGFAFSPLSPMKTSSGGYNDDGTVPANAQIIYVTPETANTVTLDVITDSKGKMTTCTGIADILLKRQKGHDKTPLIIRMIGQVKKADITGLNSSGYLEVKGCYNVTFEGVGDDATAYGWGFLVRGARNVEIRNVGIMLFPDDGISLDTDNANIWIHNNDIFYGSAGSDADQAKGDGSTDVKGNSTYVTLSYNHYWDSGKSSLCGMSDTAEFFVTYHHNWFDHSDSRHPRIRVGTIHIYNNYYDGVSKYGVGVTKGSSAFVESNYFRNTKFPMLSSLQGTDIYYGKDNATFSSEAGGIIKAFDNKVEGATRLVYAQEDSVQFDAYLASTRDEQVPDTFKTVSGGTSYNNFDTSSSMYSYTPDTVEKVKDVVTTYAGRVEGGDFNWTFTTADDTSYAINAPLMAAIKSYTSTLVSNSDPVNEKTIISITEPTSVEVEQGKSIKLPSTVTAVYSDGSSAQVAVTWEAVDSSTLGVKTVHGTIAGYDAGVDIQVNVVEASTENPPQSGDGTLFIDNFATATSSDFFTAAYKSLPTDSTKPMYIKTGGTITVSEGSVTLNGGRMTVGALSSTLTTSSSTPGGVLDLSSNYKIILKIASATGDASKKFQVYVDNNTTSAGNSIHGASSKVYEKTLSDITNGELVIESNVGTAVSFIQLRTESGLSVTISEIRIESESVSKPTIISVATPSPVTVKQGDTLVLPSKVTATYSDGSEKEVDISWEAVDTSTPGTKTVKGTVEGYDEEVTIIVNVTPLEVKDFTINSTFNLNALEAGKDLNVETSVVSNKEVTEPVMLIIALYDESDRMINLSYISKTAVQGETLKLNAGFKLPSDVTNHMVKVFVWNGTSLKDTNMKPLSNIATLK